MKKQIHTEKNRFMLIAIIAVFLAASLFSAQAFAQAGRGVADWPARVSGEFAFYRDYTFNEPAWTGVLCYDEETWAVQVFFPESGKRVTSFFKVKGEGNNLVLTGQRNDPNLQNDDVVLVNYLMQILPLLWEARRGVETQGTAARTRTQSGKESLLPAGTSLRKDTPLFGGNCDFVFSPELPLFSLKSVNNAGGRTVFAFESAGLISAESSNAFFSFEPVPQKAKQTLAETRRTGGKSGTRGNKAATEELVPVAENFFLVGNTASILKGDGETAGLTPQAFYALAAKNFLLSGDASVIPVPETFACTSDGNNVWLDQVLYMKDEKELMRKRMLLQADFKTGKYSFAEVTCFENTFAENKARLEAIAKDLIN